MDWFRNLSPKGKRIAIIAAGGVIGVVLVSLMKRKGAAPAAATAAADTSATPDAGVVDSGYGGFVAGGTLPMPSGSASPLDLSSSTDLGAIVDAIGGLSGQIAALPVASSEPSSGASAVAQDAAAVIGNNVDQQQQVTAGPGPIATTAPPAARTQPAPRPVPNALPASAGGRQVGPWKTAAMRDKAVAGIPAGSVRKFSNSAGYYAEIFG